MLRKTSYAVAGTLLALSAFVFSAFPAKAQTAREKINAMYGHPLVEELREMNPDGVAILTVAGEVGGILRFRLDDVCRDPYECLYVCTAGCGSEIELEDLMRVLPRYFARPNWSVTAGDNIILAYKDGKWMYIADAHCEMSWLNRLNLKAVPEVQQVSIDWGESKPVALPPVEPRNVAAPASAPEPIRGMW